MKNPVSNKSDVTCDALSCGSVIVLSVKCLIRPNQTESFAAASFAFFTDQVLIGEITVYAANIVKYFCCELDSWCYICFL